MEDPFKGCFDESPEPTEELGANTPFEEYLRDEPLFRREDEALDEYYKLLESNSILEKVTELPGLQSPPDNDKLPSTKINCFDLPVLQNKSSYLPSDTSEINLIPKNRENITITNEPKNSTKRKHETISINSEKESICKEYYNSLPSNRSCFEAFVCCLLANAGGSIVNANTGEVKYIDRDQLVEYTYRTYGARPGLKKSLISRFCVKNNILDTARFKKVVKHIKPELINESQNIEDHQQKRDKKRKLTPFISLTVNTSGQLEYHNKNDPFSIQKAAYNDLRIEQFIFATSTTSKPIHAKPMVSVGNLKRQYNYLIEKTDGRGKTFPAFVCCLFAKEGGFIKDISKREIQITERDKLINCIYSILGKDIPKNTTNIIYYYTDKGKAIYPEFINKFSEFIWHLNALSRIDLIKKFSQRCRLEKTF